MGRKRTILYTIPNFKTAGSQFVLLALYNHINRDLFQPYVLVEKHPDLFPDDIKHSERLFLTEEVGKPSYIAKMARLLKEKKIDLVHSWDYKSNSIEALACKRAGVRYLYTKKNNAWSKRWFAKSVLSSHIVYNNPSMKTRFFTHFLLKNKISLIPHGVNTKHFAPIESVSQQDHFVIGCVGLIGENKNQLLLIKALTNLPENVQLHCYGKEDTAYKKKLETFIKTHGLQHRVSFKGFIENRDIPEVQATFDVLVLASKQEGLPLSIIEGMACGVPVLSSNSGGGAGYLLKDNTGGYIFETEEALTSQLLELYENPKKRKALGAMGRKRVLNHFSIEKEVAAYNKLYLSLLS